MKKRCRLPMLCGISTSFPVLFPSVRQVAYALLTRPPLSILKIYRSFILWFLARLACVRHAASVHPEPGSNSQIKVFVQDQNQAWLNFYPVYLLLGCSLRTILFSNCSRICHCSVINESWKLISAYNENRILTPLLFSLLFLPYNSLRQD